MLYIRKAQKAKIFNDNLFIGAFLSRPEGYHLLLRRATERIDLCVFKEAVVTTEKPKINHVVEF